MNLKPLIFYSLLALIISFNLSAQNDSTMKFSLAEAQSYAIDNFYLTKNAQLDIESARKYMREVTAVGLPQASTSGEYQRYIDDIPSAFSMPVYDDQGNVTGMQDIQIFQKENYSLGAHVSQLIFSGEYIVGLQAAKVYKMLSVENYEMTTINLKETVAGTYFTLLILNENKRVLTKTLENLKLNLDHSQKTLAVGLIEEIDVDQLVLTVRRTENSLKTVDNQLETMQRMLKYQLGIENDVKIELTDELKTLLSQNIIDQSNYTFNLDDHIEYRLLNTQENLQELSLKREKSLLLPSISGFYNYNAVLNTNTFTPPQHMVGLTASWNIFQSGARTSKISQARIELEKAQNIKEQESQRLIFTAEQAQNNYQTAMAKYYNEETNFNLSEKVFNNTTQKYKEGFVSSLELSLINTQFLQAQLSFALAIQELLTSKVALDKAFSKL